MRISRAGTSGEEGFTLIEFSVVVLILGVVFGLIFIRLVPSLASNALRRDTQQLAETIRKARRYSVASGLLIRLRLRFQEGAWQVEGMDAQGSWNPLRNSPLPPGSFSPGVALRGVRVNGEAEIVEGEAELRFLPTGESKKALLYLADETRQERTLAVHPFLNRVEVFHGRAENFGG